MKSFNSKSRESYNEKADHYDETFEGMYTFEFKHKLLEEISVSRGVSKHKRAYTDYWASKNVIHKIVKTEDIKVFKNVDINRVRQYN